MRGEKRKAAGKDLVECWEKEDLPTSGREAQGTGQLMNSRGRRGESSIQRKRERNKYLGKHTGGEVKWEV